MSGATQRAGENPAALPAARDDSTARHAFDARTVAAWEIASVVSTTVVGEWVVLSVGGANRWLLLFPFAFAFAYIFVSHRAWRETPRALGWRFDNFLACARLLVPPMLLIGAAFTAFGYFNGYLDFAKWLRGGTLFGLPLFGVLWGLVQQYVLQGFINRRAQVVWGRGAASVIFVAAVFAALHLPNPPLTAATFLAGLIWAYVYQRAPNLLALAISHAVLTWVLISTVPTETLHGMRVGYKFFG